AAVAAIARRCADAGVPLVTVSSDYVFDGRLEVHREDEAFTPLGVYGQTKAAGDLAAASISQHWIVRATWVVGDGRNFVRTMADLAARGIDPAVVDDQFGRPTFASELARGIRHLVSTRAPFGTYNLSNSGDVVSWAEIARAVFAAVGDDPARVSETTTAAYGAG
ncbi:SDR family oxidoreductase, partial [Mesorhizobium japonicum]|uniref:SDR family oxidoreductase n=1 Tax=Mesorhizobium japonicum TaxID=2066070 RepID=UPI003B59643F